MQPDGYIQTIMTTPAAAPRISADDLDATFAALADRTRRAMIAKLARARRRCSSWPSRST
jgi:DNA-binding transcriptional ArsR family regulator